MKLWSLFFRRGGRSVAGPLLLYFLMALAMLSPFASKRLVQSTASDLDAHLSGIVEARSALLEGQFPIRVAPAQNDHLRYPIFQFYGNFPYTAGAVLSLIPGINPYTAWKLVHLFGLTLAGFFTYRSALTLTGRKVPSIVAGAAFVFAPYMWTDIHARFAFAETVSFLLLPAVIYFSLRAFVSRRWTSILFAGVSWNLLALSHNITYVYASAFLGLFFLSIFTPTLRGLLRQARVGLGYVLGVILTLWFAAPQLAVLKMLNVGQAAGSPFGSRIFTTFRTLVSPWLLVPAEAADTTARLGPQIGWPILGCTFITLLMLFFSGWMKSRGRSAVRLLACFAIAFYMVWSPNWSSDSAHPIGDFWQSLPKIFYYVQFTYRILVIVVLFGSLLVAYALAAMFPRGMKTRWLLLCLFLIGLSASSYFPRHPKLSTGDLTRLEKNPEMGQGGARQLYLMSMQSAAERSIFHPDANMAAEAFGTLGQGWLRSSAEVQPRQPGVMVLTAPRNVSALLLEGDAPRELGGPVMLSTSLDGRPLDVSSIPPGRFRLRIPFPAETVSSAPTVTVSFDCDRWIKPRSVDPVALGEDDISLHFDSVTFETPAKTYPPLIGYEQIRERVSLGAASTFIVTTNQPSIVQLPVLCYPGLMSVMDNSEPIAYQNLGRLLAVELPAGPHLIAVQFAGITWANVISGLGWLIVLAGFCIAGTQAIKRSNAAKEARESRIVERRPGSPFPLRAALAGFGSLVVGLSFASFRGVVKELGSPARLTVTASSFETADSKPRCAFDDDPTTAWVALGSKPATMTIRMSKAARLNGIVFESRQTALLESWQKIHVTLLLGDEKVHEQDFDLPQQRTTPIIQLDLPASEVDRIELSFSDPVLTTRDGTKTFNAGQVNPGYREIRLLWAK